MNGSFTAIVSAVPIPALRRAAKWLLAAAVVGSTMALGSTSTVVLCVVVLLLSLAFAAGAWGGRPMQARPAASIVVGVGLLLTAWTVLQCVPLPIEVLARIAPENADVWSRSLAPLRDAGPRWAPISLDPTATGVQVARGSAYLLTFLCALRIAARQEGVRFLERTVVVGCVAAALVAMAHATVDADRSFGVFARQTAGTARTTPLLNENHLSSYLGMGVCVALAAALDRSSRLPRAIPAACCTLLVGAQFWLASRAGVVATMIGIVTVLWLARRAKGRARAELSIPRLAAIAGATVAVGAAVLLSAERSLKSLLSTDLVKLSIIRRAADAALSFRWVGMGRGAFESVFPAFRDDGEGHIVFTHPENVVVQWAAEWGLPVAGLALVGLAVALRPRTALVRSSAPIGAAAALVAVAAHDLLDFSLEIPGVAIAAAVCAACVAGGAGDGPSGRSAWWTRSPHALVVAASAVALLAAFTAAARRHGELAADQRRMRDLAAGSSVDRERFVAAARAALLRHPADPYIPLMGAVRAMRMQDESPLPWVARSIERAAVHGRAHLLIARYLARRAPSQARLEYRLAMEQDRELAGIALEEGARLVDTADAALELIPRTKNREKALSQLTELLRARAPDVADQLDAEFARRHPQSPHVPRVALQKLIPALRDGTAPCDEERTACMERARAHAARLKALAPEECTSHRLGAELAVLSGDVTRALDDLERAAEDVRDRSDCLRAVVDLAHASGDDERVTRALEKLVAAGCSSDDACVATHSYASRVEERRQRWNAAFGHARRAHELAPERNDLLERLARVASEAGRRTEALAAWRTLAARDPKNRSWARELARARKADDAARRRLLGVE